MHTAAGLAARLLVALLVVLAPSWPQALGQTCAPLTDPTCSQFIPVGTDIFVPAWTTIEGLQALSNRELGLLNFSPHLPEPCFSAAIQITCYTYLRACQKINNESVAIPQQPCVSACETVYTYCNPLLSSFGVVFGAGLYFPPNTVPPLNCTNPPLDSDAGNTSFYTPAFSTYTWEGRNYSLPCSQTTLIPGPLDIYCGDPLVVVSVQDHLSCGFTCPLPSLTDEQYESAKIMQGILGWMSWAGTAFLLFSMALDPAARDFPRNLITMTACAANVAAGAIILPTMAGYDNIWCGGSDQYLTPELAVATYDPVSGFVDISFSIDEEVLSFGSSACTFQGAILQFGFLSAVFWWVVIAFNMALELFLGKVLPLEKRWWKVGRFVAYNVGVWGLAFLLMVIPAAAGQIKFASAATYCFLTLEDNSAWILTFWFLPVGIALLVGVVLFIMALVKVTILLITIKKVKELLLLHLRMFIFIFLYLFLFVLIFAYYIEYEKDKDQIQSGYEAYFKCIIYAQPNCGLSDSVSNYDLVMLKGWAISSLGLLLFLTFLLGPIIKFWYRFFRAVWEAIYFHKPSYVWAVIQMVSTNRSSSLSMKSENSMSMTEGGGPEDMEADDTGEDQEASSSSDSS